jgi:hypothetical protein
MKGKPQVTMFACPVCGKSIGPRDKTWKCLACERIVCDACRRCVTLCVECVAGPGHGEGEG